MGSARRLRRRRPSRKDVQSGVLFAELPAENEYRSNQYQHDGGRFGNGCRQKAVDIGSVRIEADELPVVVEPVHCRSGYSESSRRRCGRIGNGLVGIGCAVDRVTEVALNEAGRVMATAVDPDVLPTMPWLFAAPSVSKPTVLLLSLIPNSCVTVVPLAGTSGPLTLVKTPPTS